MNIAMFKRRMKESKYFGKTYLRLKNIRNNLRDAILHKARLCGRYNFEDRRKNYDKLCIILAGYKEYLYPAVFGRILRYAPDDMDICVLSSGLYSENLSRICADNDWSYLSTKANNVSLVQNIAIDLYPKAKYIFKFDEDIFISEGYFERMQRAYEYALAREQNVGVVAPLIPLNPYGNKRILERLGLVDTYTKLFEKPTCALDAKRKYYSSPEAAKFFWGEGGYVPLLDEMDRMASKWPQEEHPCPIRFSIGAIMFTRAFWDAFGQFPVSVQGGYKGHLGSDEEALCNYCFNKSFLLMVTDNVVVGHFGFAQQTAAMKEYYLAHTEKFLPPDTRESKHSPKLE